MPTKTGQDATLYVGKDYTLNFTEIDTEDLTAFNEITYAMADHQSAAASFSRTQSGGGITVAGGSNEIAQVSIAGANTTGLAAPATYYHELVTEDGSGNEQVAATGEVLLLPSVTDN